MQNVTRKTYSQAFIASFASHMEIFNNLFYIYEYTANYKYIFLSIPKTGYTRTISVVSHVH